MITGIVTRLRLLGVAHVIVGVVLLPASAFFGLLLAPVLLPGPIWLIALGFCLWAPTARFRVLLLRTHFALAALALLLCAYGILALQAARRSADEGGGLLGAFGLIPMAMGLVAGCLAAASLAVAYTTDFTDETDVEPVPGSSSGTTANGLSGKTKE